MPGPIGMTTPFYTKVRKALTEAWPTTLHDAAWVGAFRTKATGDCAAVQIAAEGVVSVEPTNWRMRREFRRTSVRLRKSARNGVSPAYDIATITDFIKTKLPKIIALMRDIDAACEVRNETKSREETQVGEVADIVRTAMASVEDVAVQVTRTDRSWSDDVSAYSFIIDDQTVEDPPRISVHPTRVVLDIELRAELLRDTLDAHPRIVAVIYERMREAKAAIAAELKKIEV